MAKLFNGVAGTAIILICALIVTKTIDDAVNGNL